MSDIAMGCIMDDLRRQLAAAKGQQAAMEEFAKLYTELKGVQAVDAHDGSPNWWMFFQDAVGAVKTINAELKERREKLAEAKEALKTKGTILPVTIRPEFEIEAGPPCSDCADLQAKYERLRGATSRLLSYSGSRDRVKFKKLLDRLADALAPPNTKEDTNEPT